MSVEVRGPMYAGVSVEHPRIISAITMMAKQGKSREDIRRVVGMPMEVIDRVAGKVK